MTDDPRMLLENAEELEHYADRIPLLERAIELADAQQDIELGMEARMDLASAATHSGHPEKTMLALAWCLAKFDEDPEQFDWFVHYRLLWQYKWGINHSLGFPHIPLQKINELHQDFDRRTAAFGAGKRYSNYHSMRKAMHLGDREGARSAFSLWNFTPRDRLSDCEACEANSVVRYHAWIGDDEKALKAAERIFGGQLTCAEIPHVTHGEVLLSLLRLGRLEEALHHHLTGYAMVKDDASFLSTVADHLRFLVLTGNFEQARQLFERHLVWSLDTYDLEHRFDFESMALFWLQNHPESTVKLLLPAHFEGHQASGVYQVAALREVLQSRLQKLANRFDGRNGTSHFQSRLSELPGLMAHATPLALQVE